MAGHRSGQAITPGQVQPGRSARTTRPAGIPFSPMRTRRIAIGCRRTGWASTVASAPDPLLALDLTLQPEPGWTTSPESPLPFRIPGTTQASRIPTPSVPPSGERDLTLADLTIGRRNLAWNDNPGWPNHLEIDWTRIARGHTPRHARRRLRALPYRAFTWTGAGILTAVLLTVLITTISELIK
ncbi:hypothetical protein GCM10009558_033100 [Virgisporangium aurantiacum]